MNTQFDVYHEMLGIPPEEQPPHHYRLLGITLFEANTEVINNAASRQMRFVRDAGVGEYSDESQRLLNEIATAKVCLLNEGRRRIYDNQLRAKLCVRPIDREVSFEPTRATRGSWVVGQSAGCDIVIECPTISRFHCRLEAGADGLFVSDRRSRNGTFVDGVRVTSRQRIDFNSTITLGKSVAVPWPTELFASDQPLRVIRIGRADSNDVVLSDATVSSHHAQIVVYDKDAIIQDLASANGTFVGQGGERVKCVRIQAEDTVSFGKSRVEAESFWSSQG